MHQVISSVSTYERSANRAQDIVELKSHVLKVFESLRAAVHHASGDEGIPSAEFLFGGYSWIRKKFMIWRIHFQNGMNSYEANPAKEWKGNPWIFAGDKEHVSAAREALSRLLISQNRAPHHVDHFKFAWEPFVVIRDMLREVNNNKQLHKEGSIGGAPQVLKVYEHLTSKYIAVDWKTSSAKDDDGIYVCGRKILGYETPSVWILDPDTLVTRHARYTDSVLRLSIERSEEDAYDLTGHLDE
jgi:hypothetical protein